MRTLVASAAIASLAALLLAGCLSTSGPSGLQPAGTPVALPKLAPLPAALIGDHPYDDFETAAASDPTDPLHFAVFYTAIPSQSPTGSTVTDPILPGMFFGSLATSHDGGATWQNHALPHAGASAPTSKWGLFCAEGDPNVFFDKAGVVHIVILALSCGGPGLTTIEGIVHATTRDDGATWSEPDVAWFSAGGVAVFFHDREWSGYDAASGRIGIAWTKFEAALQRTTLSAVFSSDGGHTWSLPEEIESGLSLVDGRNWLVHAMWASDGKFHVSGLGDGAGASLVHWVGAPGGPWQRASLSMSDCEGASGSFGYATAAEPLDGTLVAAADVHDAAAPKGVCVFTSPDAGKTWPNATWMPGADHPWLAPGPQGTAALAYLAMTGPGLDATPTLALLDPATRAPLATQAMGDAYNADGSGRGFPVYGHYDALAAAGGRFVWALTRPGAQDMTQSDVWGYAAQLAP